MGRPGLSPEVVLLGAGAGEEAPPQLGRRRPTRGLEFLFPSPHVPPSPFSPSPTSRAARGRAGETQRRGAGREAQEQRGEGPWTRGKAGPLGGGPRRQAPPRPRTSGPGARTDPAAQPARPSGLEEGEGAAGGASPRRGAGRTSRAAAIAAGHGHRLRGLRIQAAGQSTSCRAGGGEFWGAGLLGSQRRERRRGCCPVLRCWLRPHHTFSDPGEPAGDRPASPSLQQDCRFGKAIWAATMAHILGFGTPHTVQRLGSCRDSYAGRELV